MVIPKTYGRMGNFLFQAACAIAYAHDNKLEFTVPTTTNDAKWNPIYLQHLANPNVNLSLPSHEIVEAQFTYAPLPWKREWIGKNIILDGYWQNEKYFKHIRDKIIELFGFPWELEKGVVSVHVRRGDYLTIKKGSQFKHPPVTQHWIHDQMGKFPGARFLFFSDDLDWCERVFHNRKDCEFHEGNEVEDLTEMSCCEHHICSASTFSWWGAWLNQNPKKRIIMPRHWLSPGWGGIDTSDVVPKEWERC